MVVVVLITSCPISHRLNLADAPNAYKQFNNKEENWIKVVMKPN